jgi:hypothetical protein
VRCGRAEAEMEGSPVRAPVRVGMGASSSEEVASAMSSESARARTVGTGETGRSRCRGVGMWWCSVPLETGGRGIVRSVGLSLRLGDGMMWDSRGFCCSSR